MSDIQSSAGKTHLLQTYDHQPLLNDPSNDGHSPEVYVRRELAFDKVLVLHRGLMQGHGSVQKWVASSPTQAGRSRWNPGKGFPYTLNTSSAVLRTINDLGSDWDKWRRSAGAAAKSKAP